MITCHAKIEVLTTARRMCLTQTQSDWDACGNVRHKDQLYIQNGDTDIISSSFFFFNLIHLRPCRVTSRGTVLNVFVLSFTQAQFFEN